MSFQIVVDLSFLQSNNGLKYILEPVFEGKSSFEILVEKISKFEYDKIIFSDNKELPEDIIRSIEKYNFKIYKSNEDIKDFHNFIEELYKFAVSEKSENIILLYGDYIFLDVQKIEEFISIHNSNLTEYTFGENYVTGIVPEIVTKEFLGKIKSIPARKPDILSRRIFDNLEMDINKFFIEVDIAEVDFSMKRIELAPYSKRNLQLIKNLLKFLSPYEEYRNIYNAIENNPEVLHIYPKYVEIEITNKCNQQCIYCPRTILKRKEENMDFSLYKRIVDELSNTYEDIVLSFTLMGEPLLHPEFKRFVEYTLKESKIYSLIVETNGTLLDNDIIDFLSKFPLNKLIVIFNINSLDEEVYSKLHGSNLFSKVVENIKKFLTYNDINKYRSFIQIIKMKDNFYEIDKFYEYWKKFTDNIIIQKYNNYAGKLIDKNVVDLTPIDRIPCWHLQRDMEIFVNGDVPVCKQVINDEIIVGNIGNSSIKEIWNKMEEYYKDNYLKKYKKLTLCQKCDEWYTYNF